MSFFEMPLNKQTNKKHHGLRGGGVHGKNEKSKK
jgi:hypothetical protein